MGVESKTEDEVTSSEVVPTNRRPCWKRRWVVMSLLILVVLSSAIGWGYWNDMKDKQAIEYLEERGYFVGMTETKTWYDFRIWVNRFVGVKLDPRWHVDRISNDKHDRSPRRYSPNNFSLRSTSRSEGVDPFIDVVGEDLKMFRRFRQLKELSLVDAGLTDGDLVFIRAMRELENLDLSGNELAGGGFKYLAGMRGLSSLKCRGNRIVDEHLHLLARLPLYTLDMGYNLIDGTGLPPHAGIVMLRLEGMRLADQVVAQLKSYTALRVLHLNNSHVSVELLADLASLVDLKYLILLGTGITREEVLLLASSLNGCRLNIEKSLFSEEEIKEFYPNARILRSHIELRQ